jgi:arabinofuranosyltransferase
MILVVYWLRRRGFPFGVEGAGVVVLLLVLLWVLVAVGLIAAWPVLGRRRGAVPGFLAGVLGFALVHLLMYGVVAEDAYISLRYSQQLADGNGPVFNVGEKVEGYSNFLWVVLVAIPAVVAGADVVTVARVLGVLCALATIVVAFDLVRRISGSAPAGLLAATVIAASGGLAGYGASGLETPLFVLLMLLTLLAVWVKRPLLAGVLVALATMTRPDGALIAVLIGGWLIWRAFRTRTGWRAPVWYLAGALVLAVPWTIWRLTYYGHLLPNAVVAKSGVSLDILFGIGWDYLLGFVTITQALLLLVPVAIFLLAFRRGDDGHEARALIWLIFGLASAYTTFVVLVGGDWMPAYRLFAPVVPLLVVGIAAVWALPRGLDPDRPRPLPRAGAVVAASLALLMIAVSATHTRMRPAFLAWERSIAQLADTGRWLDRSLPPDAVISTYANGALTFATGNDRMVVDQLGLTDEHIARNGKRDPNGMVGHQAYDFEYLVDVRRPDVMVTDGRGFLDSKVCTPATVFAEDYQLANFQVGEQWLFLYVRKDKADALLGALGTDPRFRYQPC